MTDAGLSLMENVAILFLDFVTRVRRRPVAYHLNFVARVARLDSLIFAIGRNHFLRLRGRAVKLNGMTLRNLNLMIADAQTFKALGRSRSPTLLLGMNAHINLDLGIAAATVAPTPAELQALWPDFKTINEVLSRLVKVVEDELGQISPRLAHIEDFAPGLEDRIFDFGIDVARDFAWSLAKELSITPPSGWGAVIAKRDALVAEMAAGLYPLHGLAGEVQRWIHGAESADVRFNIQVIAE